MRRRLSRFLRWNTRVPRGRWHCPSARWEREREEREANRRRLAGATTTTTTTTTRREGSTSRAARMARAERRATLPLDWVCWKRWSILRTRMCTANWLRENALVSAANEDPAHRENRLVRERRQRTECGTEKCGYRVVVVDRVRLIAAIRTEDDRLPSFKN